LSTATAQPTTTETIIVVVINMVLVEMIIIGDHDGVAVSFDTVAVSLLSRFTLQS
jgi:hypothetical protein